MPQNIESDTDLCPVCRSTATVRAEPNEAHFDCPRCGTYFIDFVAVRILRTLSLQDQALANASGWVREHQGIRLKREDAEWLSKIHTPSTTERAMKLLLELARRMPYVGDMTTLNFGTPEWLGITWSNATNEVEFLFQFWLVEPRLTSGSLRVLADGSHNCENVTIKPAGHMQLDHIRQGGVESMIGFCAMWFAPEMLPAWTEGISPAISDAGYEPLRIDNVQHNNKIDDEIIAAIRKSRFIVTDLTGNRGGVYFEAGFAMGRSIPVVWTVRADHLQDVHFDNRQYNFIVWSPDTIPDLRIRLRNRIEATIGQGPLRAEET